MALVQSIVKTAFFSRAIDGISREEVAATDQGVRDALEHLGIHVVNVIEPEGSRCRRISDISQIVEGDLAALENSDIVVADLSWCGRSYVGAIFELARAFDLGKQIYVWVGESGNEQRLWLQYHATAICRTFGELVELLYLTLTPEGRSRNRAEVIGYYSSVAGIYDKIDRIRSDRDVHKAKISRFLAEYQDLRGWAGRFSDGGILVDLGSGTGSWVSVWRRSANLVVCVDVSEEMLGISRKNNCDMAVEHVRGNVLDTLWLSEFFSGLRGVRAITLAFLLTSFTPDEERGLLKTLRSRASPGTRLIVLDNQSSVFSELDYFSRTEIQHRRIPHSGKQFTMWKRNFLAYDLKRVLSSFGEPEEVYCTNDFFIAGSAIRS